MDYDGFITTVQQEAAISREEAERAVRATLQTLAERVSGGEAEDVGRQLPDPLRELLRDGSKAQPFGLEEFLRRVAEREGADPTTAERDARAVFAALGRAISRDELADLASELPKDFGPLLEAMLAQPSQPGSSAPSAPPLSARELIAKVAERAGLDEDGARRAIEAVLEALADRISGGQVDDLERELPSELHPPLERGKAQSHGAARPLSLEEFVRGTAEREGVTPDEARAHARSVFATLREAISEKEFSDVVAQLPDEYAALMARP
jgi:uncharacterized protein (DUF2267 family)